jgi:hypothetical protein
MKIIKCCKRLVDAYTKRALAQATLAREQAAFVRAQACATREAAAIQLVRFGCETGVRVGEALGKLFCDVAQKFGGAPATPAPPPAAS